MKYLKNSYYQAFEQVSWEETQNFIYSRTAQDVAQSLAKSKKNWEDFLTFVSPAATGFLEAMAQESQRLSLERFGKTINLYAPLYLSNECSNICTYCGFSKNNPIERLTLNDEQIEIEAQAVKELGFDSVLLVTGESHRVGYKYFKNAIQQCTKHFNQISLEVQPLEQDEYQGLIQSGLSAVYVYQETYHESDYRKHHSSGKKANFRYRLETPDRLGRAGIHKTGLGVLLGLEDWRTDSAMCAHHLEYLEKTYWQTRYSLSFPRLRPCAGGLAPKVEINDREFVQLMLAWRLFRQDVEISLSTRESALTRDHLIPLGVTHMSAGSKTDPGGYKLKKKALEQFSISDERSPKEVAKVISRQGYEAVWKDWDPSLFMNNDRPKAQ